MTQEKVESQEKLESQKPVFGATGRKIVYDKDGKPCRACNSLLDFQMVTGKVPKTVSKVPETTDKKPEPQSDRIGGYTKDYPPDVEKIGRSSWTLLHSIAATYPEEPTNKQQSDLKQFLKLFGNFYPCWYCGEDFERYMSKNEPNTATQDGFGRWLCEAHNDVNHKLGKPKFNCDLWKKRWKDGWDE